MDINQLPLEILQKILSYLSYDEHKEVSLVCRRWNQASELYIVQHGRFHISEQDEFGLEVIRDSIRRHRSIAVSRMNNWNNLLQVVSECAERFPNIPELYLVDMLQDYLFRFYQTYSGWMEQLVSLEVSLSVGSADYFVCGPEHFVLTLPNLKQLVWRESLFGQGQKTVTIDAPALEKVYFYDSWDASSVLKIPHCERIKFIRCTLHMKHFDDTFIGNYGNVEVLILNFVHDKCDIGCVSRMPRLRYLALDFPDIKEHMQQVEAMSSSKLLTFLSIRADKRNVENYPVNLGKILRKFENLKTLDIVGICFEATGEIQADQLVFFNLRKIVRFNSSFSLKALKLKTLSLEVSMLDNIRLSANQHLAELNLNLGALNLNESFEHIICPFLRHHRHVKKLILIRDNYEEGKVRDDIIHDLVLESVEHLELHGFDITIKFFQLLERWKSLKSMKIDDCTINCGEMLNVAIRLPGLKRMMIDGVRLRGSSRVGFPIWLANGADSNIKRDDLLEAYTTMKLLQEEDYKFRSSPPFCCPKIKVINCDPIMYD